MAAEKRRTNPVDCFDDAAGSQLPPAEARAGDANEEEEDDSSEDFEFSFAVRNPVDLPIVTADELFSGGRILPAYPVFGRLQDPAVDGDELQVPLGRLSIDDGSARPSEADAEREAAGESAPARCKKSASTGSTGRARRWKLRDLVMGRSRSDGKEKFSFIETEPQRSSTSSPPEEAAKEKVRAGDRGVGKAKGAAAGQRVREMDMVAAHRLYYGGGKGSSDRATTRRSFLPYRRELVGLFAPVNRLSW